MSADTLASELLHEQKANFKRLFVVLLVVIGLWFATIAGFVVYLSLPSEEVIVENDSGNANYIGDDLNGVINNNGENTSNPVG